MEKSHSRTNFDRKDLLNGFKFADVAILYHSNTFKAILVWYGIGEYFMIPL